MRITWVRWREDPKMKDIELEVVLNHRDEAPHRKASRILSNLLLFPSKLEHHFSKEANMR